MTSRRKQKHNTCVSVWNSGHPLCTGWHESGHHLHGCSLPSSHYAPHRCKCGMEVDRGSDLLLPPPRVR